MLIDENAKAYDAISTIETNSSDLQGIEAGSGGGYNSVSDDSIRIAFPAKIPDPLNPNRVNVVDWNIVLDVNAIETKPDGLKTYYGQSNMMSNNVGDLSIESGKVEQTSDTEAVATLVLG